MAPSHGADTSAQHLPCSMLAGGFWGVGHPRAGLPAFESARFWGNEICRPPPCNLFFRGGWLAPAKSSSFVGRPPSGLALLRDPLRNKGTAFTLEERDALGLRGLLPARVHTQDEQASRVMLNLRNLSDPLEKYVALNALHDRNEALFFRVVIDHIDEIMPIIYTPTVGLACQKFGQIFQRPRGVFITIEDRGRVAEVLRNWPYPATLIVVTDGERILGLGDLGANGMGIPVGKLALYTGCGGIDPRVCLPVTLDVGTNNAELLADPYYVGLRQRRVTGAAYDELMEEFITAAHEVFPASSSSSRISRTTTRFRLLEKYRDRIPTFQRRHTGHRRGRARGHLFGAARDRGKLDGSAIPVHGRRRSGSGHRRPDLVRDGEERARRLQKHASAAGSSIRRDSS